VPLARQFVDDIATAYVESPKTLASAAEDALLRYDWPGNVRELRNAIERAFLFCGDRTIDVAHLPAEVRDATRLLTNQDPWTHPNFETDSIPRLADAERLLIARVLKVTGGNQSDAARLLDIERHRLRRKIVAHGLEHLAHIRPR
jgi:DNA-binding NtrC family response regulator